MKTNLAAIAAALLFATSAEAQPVHQRKTGKLRIDVDPSTAPERRPSRADRRAPLTSEQFLDAVARTGDFRDSKIRRLAELVKRTPKQHEERPDLLLRLAEAHAARMRHARMQGFALLEKAEGSRGAARRRLLARREAARQTERAAMRRAIAVYAELADDPAYVDYPHMDRALFYYADTLRRAGRATLALAVYRELVRRHPKSRLVGYAYFAFAEHHFAARELATADKLYKAVLEFPKLSIYNYALYKRGWVQLNLGRHAEALATFYEVARRTRAGDPLRRQATRDFARTYAEIGKPQRALAAFRRIDRPRALELLEVLALHYVDRGKHRAAIYTLRELIRRRPRAAEVCEWQLLVADTMLRAGTKRDAAAETVKLIDVYRALRRRGGVDPGVLRACADDTERVAGRLAKVWHVESDKTHDQRVADRAAAIYRAYLAAFGRRPGASKMRFHLGDLLWTSAERTGPARLARRRWRQAAAAFDDVVDDRRAPAALVREAAYASVLAWLNALRLDPTAALPDPGDAKPRPRPLRGDYAALVRSFARYEARVPARRGDRQRVDIEFLHARTLWKHDQLERALPRLRRHVAAHPKHPTAEFAANMIIDSLIRLERFAELARVAAAMRANRALIADRPKLVERLGTIAITAARRRAKELERDRRWLACGKAYLAIAEAHRDAPHLDEILYNAGHCFERARSIGFALAMFRQLRAELPDSELAERALIRLGRASSRIAEYASAAKYYEEYARKYAGEQDAAAALSDAVTYRRALGDDGAAIRDIEYFVRAFGARQPGEAAAALFGLAAIHARRGDRGAATRTLERYLRRFAAAGGPAKEIVAHAWLGEIAWRRSCRKPRPDGMCATIQHKPRGSAAAICGGVARPLIAVIRRDRRLVGRARRHFERALELADRNRAAIARLGDGERAGASFWSGAARFYLAEAKLERFLANRLPALDFDPRRPAKLAASRRAFARWMRQATASGEVADAGYRAILEGDNAVWAIAAAARMGQIPATIADGVYRLGVPAHIAREPDLTDRYCTELEREVAPLEKRAVTALSFCLRESSTRGATSRWSTLCELELDRLRPRQHPADRERAGEADRVAPILDDGGLIGRLSGLRGAAQRGAP